MKENDDEILKYHFSKYLDDDLEIGFYPYFIGYEKTVSSKPISIPKEDEYTFHFILSGHGFLKSGKGTVRLGPNDIFFFPPSKEEANENTGYYPDKSDPWEYIWFNMKGEKTDRLIKSIKLTKDENHYSVENYGIIKQELQEMIHIARNTTKRNSSYYFSYVMRFFGEIADERKLELNKDSKKEKRVKEILDYMEKNYTNPELSVKKIADDMFYSIAYISRIFSEVTGKTPIEYVTSLRMLKALDMLRSGNYTIAIISETVGYSSPFYFSKKFKEYFGYPPSRYQK